MVKKVWIVVLSFLLSSCDNLFLGEPELAVSLEENLQAPPNLNDGWKVSDPEAQNIDAAAIADLITFIHEKPQNIHSLLIIRNGKLVAESYFGGWNRHRLHTLRSASKSFVSTLFGIAQDQGYVQDLGEPLYDYFPDYPDLENGEKSEIRLKHILTMSAGFEWDEKSDGHDDQEAFERSDHRLQYLFDKSIAHTPGEVFVYNSALPVVQASIIDQVVGQDIPALAQASLFEPLGIKDYYWRVDKNDGLITSIGPLFLCTRDMAKLGQLFLDDGLWNGKQVVSQEWVQEATATHIGNEDNQTGYGYNWWTGRFELRDGRMTRIFFARGSGGQYIFVAPGFNAVVAFTSGNFPPLNQTAPVGMLTNVILPAMK